MPKNVVSTVGERKDNVKEAFANTADRLIEAVHILTFYSIKINLRYLLRTITLYWFYID